MSAVGRIVLLILETIAALWSFITLAVATALVSRTGLDTVSGGDWPPANAVLAAAVLSFVYFLVALILIFVLPNRVIKSVMVDTICLGIFWAVVLGGAAAMSVYASDFQDYSFFTECKGSERRLSLPISSNSCSLHHPTTTNSHLPIITNSNFLTITMSPKIARAASILKAIGAFWSAVTVGITAAFIAGYQKQYGGGQPSNVIVVASALSLVYFLLALAHLLLFPLRRITTVLADAIVFFILWVVVLEGAASMSARAAEFRQCAKFTTDCKLAIGSNSAAWVLWIIISAVFLLEVIYTLKNHGRSLAIWKTPFRDLAAQGSFVDYSGEKTTGAVPMGRVPDSRAGATAGSL
ncbi:hypothetical protein P7C73_g4909, partial [Tremellales sp. Uapishka_1]